MHIEMDNALIPRIANYRNILSFSDEGSGGLSGGATAAAVIGSLLGIVLVAVIGFVLYQKSSAGLPMLPKVRMPKMPSMPSKTGLRFPNPSFKASEDKAVIVDNEQSDVEPPTDLQMPAVEGAEGASGDSTV